MNDTNETQTPVFGHCLSWLLIKMGRGFIPCPPLRSFLACNPMALLPDQPPAEHFCNRSKLTCSRIASVEKLLRILSSVGDSSAPSGCR